MKRFLIVCISLLLLALGGVMVYYRTSFYIDLRPDAPVTSFAWTEGSTILVDTGNGPEPFEIRGVDLGTGKPGHFSSEYAVTQEEYLRWFGLIQEMGANCLRVYTVNSPDFYEALYQYNRDNPEPLYLLQGLWVNDYLQNSHRDAYDADLLEPLLEDAKIMVDVIHGRRTLPPTQDMGDGRFRRDISPWVLGYLLGVEWNELTVAFTDHQETDRPLYQGQYFYASPEATPFESLLAQLGDTVASYEAGRYKEQRLISFANWPTTGPFAYSGIGDGTAGQIAQVDVEQILTTEAFQSGQFASYRLDPSYYYGTEQAAGEDQELRTYLEFLIRHHSMPVVISDFGFPSGRILSEEEQGLALAACYQDIQNAGCAGALISGWQDEWYRRTWNTIHAVDLDQNVYWRDVQTNDQTFGLLSFDPGENQSVCYVDGDRSEWTEADQTGQTGGFSLSLKYDEAYLYFLVEGPVDQGPVYLPLDITPNSGSHSSRDPAVAFDRAADFLLVLDGEEGSRALVQERYDCLRAMYGRQVLGFDPYESSPAADSDLFDPIRLVQPVQDALDGLDTSEAAGSGLGGTEEGYETYETGILVCGNGNPASPDFNSLADLCYGDGFLEVRIPWQMLNFSNPSNLKIHDDYYLHYGVEEISLSGFWAGAGLGTETISLSPFTLEGWGDRVTYHERLKESYYIIQELWT